jgi:precorrin-6x reductase
VVDATHPYASEVSANIRRAAEVCQLPYERLLRPSEDADGVIWADSPQMAAQILTQTGKPALLTTGSKDLDVFTAVPDYPKKLWVRVLPNVDSLTHALELGFPPSHVICMQGPFSREMNIATLRQIGATILVTKDSGKTGGFPEKRAAAAEAGAELLVIRRPTAEEGKTLEVLVRQLCEEAET